MQIAYIMAFLVTLFVVTLTQGRDTAEMVDNDAGAAAQHMAMWHAAATRLCAETACAGGVVNAVARLPPQVAAGSAFASGNFISRYDNVNNRIVTYMRSPGAGRGTATYGRVAAGLQDLTKRLGETSHTGTWNLPTRRVSFGNSPNGTAPKDMVLPSPFMGATIPDGSPVIVGPAR